MSDYGFAFAMLPLAFLAVICTASGLRAAYVCRVPGDVSVWFEGTAVLLACDLLLDCLDMRAAAVHIAVRGLHPLLLIPALGLSFAGLWHLCRREMRTLIKGRCIAQAALLFAAAVLALGALSNHFPWSTPMAALLLIVRWRFLWQRPRAERERIREGLDTLPEGILFAHGDGRIVLANLSMLDFMEGIAGVQFRNAEAFWQCLEAIAGKRVSVKASGTLIFRFRHSAWLLRRKAMKGGCIEITASNVTELDAVTRELEAKNAVLAEQAAETKRLLQSAVEQERLKTLEKVRVRVHDIMGSRISMLQRLLTAPEPLEAAKLVPTVDMVLEEIWLEEESPQELLEDLVRAYEAFGVKVQLTGQLPAQRTTALAFVEILREAATNGICHGHADTVEVTMSETGLRIADNGCGAPPDFHPGSGLSAIIRRVKLLGAHMTISPQPSFTLTIEGVCPAPKD